MRRPTTAAVVAILFLAAPRAEAFSLSSIESLLAGIGVNIDLPEVNVDLPPRAEEAVTSALGRADAALDRVFGDGGVLDGIDVGAPLVDVPIVALPDVDQIVEDALSRAREARADATARAQAAVDRALGRANDVLDGIAIPDVTLPEVSIPDVDQIVEDALASADAARDRAQQAVDDARDRAQGFLDGIDLPVVTLPDVSIPDASVPDVDQIVNDALNRAQSAVDQALDRASGVLEDVDQILDESNIDALIDGALDEASGVVEDVLGGGGLLDGILSDLSVDLPPVALQAIESVSMRVESILAPAQPATAVPEPTGVALAMVCLAAGSLRRRT